MPVAEHRREAVVAVGEEVRLDPHRLTDHPLGWEAACVDLRTDRLDGDPFATVSERKGRF